MASGNPEYRDRLFSFIFSSEEHKDWTLSLYNAVNGTHYTDPDAVSIETIQQVLYLSMHNDVAFIIADTLSLYEQQSTFNPNMPLRMLEYTANLFEKYIKRERRNKYGRSQIMLPVPKLVVFYNGLEEEPGERLLQLSDAFSPEHRADADIDVRVRMININQGYNTPLMDACQPLDEYVGIIESIRRLKRTQPLEAAIDQTIDTLPDASIIKPYLSAHKAEVKNMLLTEYNETETMELFKEEGRAEGRQEGEDRLGALIARLISANRTGDITRAVSEPDYRKQLYAEYGL